MNDLQWEVEDDDSVKNFWQEFVSGAVQTVINIPPTAVGMKWPFNGTIIQTDTGFWADNPHADEPDCFPLEGVDNWEEAKAVALAIWRMS